MDTKMTKSPSLVRRVASAAAVLGMLATATPGSAADAINCALCHDDVAVTSTAHEGVACQDCHTNVTSKRHKAADLAELSGDKICAQCHRMAARALSGSVHKDGAGCQDCHDKGHVVAKNGTATGSTMSPVNQVRTCGGCHNQPPELVQGYVDSVHGRGLLISGLNVAPGCSSCHGSHKILPVHDPKARTSHEHSPEMCGECHEGVLRVWKDESAHGAAWKADEPNGPVCTTCHASHAISDPVNAGPRLKFPNQCGDCHGKLYSSYRGGFHGKFTQLGLVAAATCSDCHSPHKNLGVDNPASTIHPDNRAKTCGQCHGEVPAAFLQIDMHNDPTDPNDNAYVYYIYLFMMSLLIGVFAFFGIHDLLWLQRAAVGALRGEYGDNRNGLQKGKYVRRFRGMYIAMHIVIVLTFLTLALTGLPLKFDTSPWAQNLMDFLGGIDSARFLHRAAAIGTFGYAFFHFSHLIIRAVVGGERRELLWGPSSMVPQLQDLKDMWGNLRYFMYLGPRPEGDRWTYWEKFDYLAVFWGIVIIGLSGLMLWKPIWFTSFLPGWAINAAYIVHSDEALLATGFIFVFHFFHTHLRPESFPMDPVVFTGRMPLEKFKEERPREYKRMVESGELEKALCEPPTREEMVWVYVFGFTALSIGLALAVGIFWALLSH
jgi:thiosulfate reductase cytochrome b subunit